MIAADMPIGLVVRDGDTKFEAIANADNGPAKGREFEIADLLRYIKTAGIDNTVWLTADVHYTAAHYYDPAKAQFQDFNPFWEFVSGPLHAGTFGPNDLDMTFGPELKFIKAPDAGAGQPAALRRAAVLRPRRHRRRFRATDGAADGSRRQRALQGDARPGSLGLSRTICTKRSGPPQADRTGMSVSRDSASARRIAGERNFRPHSLIAAGIRLLLGKGSRNRPGHHRVDAVFGIRKSLFGGGLRQDQRLFHGAARRRVGDPCCEQDGDGAGGQRASEKS